MIYRNADGGVDISITTEKGKVHLSIDASGTVGCAMLSAGKDLPAFADFTIPPDVLDYLVNMAT